MNLPSVTNRYRVDNMVKNGLDGGFPVGSPEARAVIAKVGRQICGKNWQPSGSGYEFYGRDYRAISKTRMEHRD